MPVLAPNSEIVACPSELWHIVDQRSKGKTPLMPTKTSYHHEQRDTAWAKLDGPSGLAQICRLGVFPLIGKYVEPTRGVATLCTSRDGSCFPMFDLPHTVYILQ